MLAARQGGAGQPHAVIGQADRIAETDHPGVVQQQEVEHGGQHFGRAGGIAQVPLGHPGGSKEDREHILLPGNPGKRLQGEGFCGIGGNGHGRGHLIGRKEFVNVCRGHFSASLKQMSRGRQVQATVLIVDGIVTNRIMLKVQLSAAYYHVVQTDRIDGIATLARRVQPDLIVTAMTLPDGNAPALRRTLQADPLLAAIPVLAIAVQNDRSARMAALSAGIDDVLNQPVDDQMLQARIRSLLRIRSNAEEFGDARGGRTALGFGEASAGFAPPARIALLAGSPVTGRHWKASMQARGSHSYSIEGIGDVAGLMRDPVADAFVIRIGRSDRRGLHLLADLKARAATCHAVLMAVVDPPDSATAADALDRGASDVLTDGFCAEELALRLTTQLRRKAMADGLRASVRDGLREAVLDPMTGLYNRRHALPWLDLTIRRSADSRHSFAVMLADLDHFKAINDRYGHLAGDAVLVETASRLSSILRPQDMLARIGGEEFMLVLPDLEQAEASAVAGRLCREISCRPFLLDTGERINVTISIGVVIGQPRGPTSGVNTADVLIAQADQALYAAKGGGRNKISLIRPAA